MHSRLLTCAAGWQRVVLDTALSPVQSRLLTCAAGVVDAPVSDRSSYSSFNPVLGCGLRNCRLAESCLILSLSLDKCSLSLSLLAQHCGERERRNCCKWLLPFCTGGCERVVLAALPSPVQSQLLTCAAGCQRVVLAALPSPVQSQLPTCAAG